MFIQHFFPLREEIQISSLQCVRLMFTVAPTLSILRKIPNIMYNFDIKMSRVGSTVGSVIFRNGSGSIREK